MSMSADAETTPQLAPYGVTVTQVIRLPELIEFRADKRVRKKLFEGAQLWGELLCYEAGQATPSHHHPAEDELFVILEGHAAVLAGDNELDAPAVSLVIVPANVPHGFAQGIIREHRRPCGSFGFIQRLRSQASTLAGRTLAWRRDARSAS